MRTGTLRMVAALAGLGLNISAIFGQNLGIFEGATDIGNPGKKGTIQFDAAKGSYVVTGGGSNMWFASDSFHFVWKKVSGDVSLAADIDLAASAGDPHRKAVLVVRQTLDA